MEIKERSKIINCDEKASLLPVEEDGETENLKILKKRRLIKRRNKKAYNVSFKRSPKFQKLFDIWHWLLDISWWKIFLGFFAFFIFTHSAFGFLYFLGGPKAISNLNLTNHFFHFLSCFFFSIQTFSTIGYGEKAPITIYANLIVSFQIFVEYFFETFWLSLLLGKFSRPTKVRKNIKFSKKAVIYKNKREDYTIAIRIADTRHKTVTLNPSVRLVLFEYHKDIETKYKLHDLEVKIHGLEDPILAIPFRIKHVVDESSQFYKFLKNIDNQSDPFKKLKNWELIVYYTGTDSSTSNDYQAVSSYCFNDVIIDRKFEKCFYYKKKKGKYVMDYSKFDKTYVQVTKNTESMN